MNLSGPGRAGRAWELVPAVRPQRGRCRGELIRAGRTQSIQHSRLTDAERQGSCCNQQRLAQNHTAVLKSRWHTEMGAAGVGHTILIYWSFFKCINHSHIFMPLSVCSLCLKHPQTSEELKSCNLTLHLVDEASRALHYTLQLADKHDHCQ